MKRCKVLIPFHFAEHSKDYAPNDELEVTDEGLARIKAVNVNMVEVIGEVKPKAKRKSKE